MRYSSWYTRAGYPALGMGRFNMMAKQTRTEELGEVVVNIVLEAMDWDERKDVGELCQDFTAQILQAFKDAGGVFAVEDAELPENPYPKGEAKAYILPNEELTILSDAINEDYLNFGVRVGFDKMLKADYRKTEEIEIT